MKNIQSILDQFEQDKQTYRIKCFNPTPELKTFINKVEKHGFSDKDFIIETIHEALIILLNKGNEEDIEPFYYDSSLLEFLDNNEDLIHSKEIKEYDTFADFLNSKVIFAKEYIFEMTKTFIE